MRAATLLAIAIGLVCPIASAAMIPAADIQPTGGGWTVGRISTAGAPGNVINRTPETSKYFAMGNVDGAGPFGGPYTARFRFIEPVSLGAMHLWNNFGTLENDGEGLADFTLTFRDGELDILGAHADRARDVFAMQTFVFAAPVAEVRYVDITIESNHDADLAYAGFHEISFVPEPAAILILALGAGLSRRRRTAR
jgi:hypothetical protein